MTAAVAPATCFDVEDRQARALVKDLHLPRPAVYWTDFLVTAAVGWSAFALAAVIGFSAASLVCAAIAVFAFYRGLCFLHEISHITRKELGGFEKIWNLLIGYPLLMPSFVYVGVHQFHHGLGTYGTSADPEYLPFARSRAMTIVFALESFLIPAALLVRFLVFAPIGLIAPGFQNWLVRHASSLTMNFAYRRETTRELVARVRWNSAAILLMWAGAAVLLPWRVFAMWFAVVSVASFVNTLRTLGAHRYQADGEPMDRGSQLQDSIDVPGAVWTELWAPVGLRYHALHHYFPGIPYHNLAKAHARLVQVLPSDSVYRGVESPGLLASLAALLSSENKSR